MHGQPHIRFIIHHLYFETVNERIFTIRVKLKHSNLALISTHASTEGKDKNFIILWRKLDVIQLPITIRKLYDGISTRTVKENIPIYIQHVETKQMIMENELSSLHWKEMWL